MALLIAELCQNHNGDLKILDEMVSAAASNGADYAKIQAIDSSELTFRDRFEKGLIEGGKTKTIKRPFESEYERLKKLDLKENVQLNFYEICKKYKVKPMTTLFTRSKIPLVKKMNLDILKISSFDCASHQMIDDLKFTGITNFIISTGATLDREIIKTSEIMKKNNLNFTFLHCVSIYPTPLKDVNLNRLNFLKKLSNKVGLSDHTNPSINKFKNIAVALSMGAEVVEKHFTILSKDKTKDGPVSANPEELKEISKICKMNKKDLDEYVKDSVPEKEMLLGKEIRELSDIEFLNRDYYQGRFASKINDELIYNWDPKKINFD